MNDTNPVLYNLMRNDLPSMNTGKGMAQSVHVGSAFAHEMLVGKFPNAETNATNDELYKKWLGETSQGFGTVLTVAVNERQMRSTVQTAHMLGFVTNVIHDPSYPVLIPTELGKAMAEEGDPAHAFFVGENFNYTTIPLDTCAFVFGDKNDPTLEVVVGLFPLHP